MAAKWQLGRAVALDTSTKCYRRTKVTDTRR